jgi:CO/xanthine dehydrogenase FAD-binding subunit
VGLLAGQRLSDETIRAAAAPVCSGVALVNADIHASEDYRRAMIPVFIRRALEKARQRA